ncbi:SDR family NAD(P)-dependent oxidoreductase [Kocuria massiliensis]|uniref:SDR family NAD(P)-dependent oxidoreductase n=1 Tax=Kocuria massiliensis TaxID=1926282 RepID=UPI0022B99761|nr:SDR family NAD(P)-dependent oxidoreductase [Kocuria massiliensis]
MSNSSFPQSEAADSVAEIRRLAEQHPDRRVVVVTGASGGIGSRVAEDLSRDSIVVAIGRNDEKLREVVERSTPNDVVPLILDLNDTDTLQGALADLPRVDALVNAAAIASRFTLDDARAQDWDTAFHTNVTAPAELTRTLLPHLRKSRGTVVFLGSGASRSSNQYNVVYSATKHALQAVADGFRRQVSRDGVRVATVAPGPTDTTMVRWQDDYPKAEPPKFIDPATVARSIRHVVDAPEDTQITEVWVRPRVEA